MSVNLLKTVQQNLGYPELQKMNPNTQVVVEKEDAPAEDKFSQAAIPAVITGFYIYTQSDEGATEFLNSDNSTRWIIKIFGDNEKGVIQTISAYSKRWDEDTFVKMDDIANEVAKSVKENLPANATIKDVKTFLGNQKNNTLLYLPAELNIGGLLNNNSLDDDTNKMEGPVSGLIRNIGDAFSTPVTGEENHDLQTETEKKEERVY